MKLQTWDASDYAKHSQPQWTWAMDFLRKVDLLQRRDLLDLGCGDGKITAHLYEKVQPNRIVGFDASQEMIDFAKENFPSDRFEGLSFIQGDAAKIPFESEFDQVVSFTALHWVQDHKALLEGISRALRPGGRVSFMFVNSTPKSLVYAREATFRKPEWKKYEPDVIEDLCIWKKDEYREMVEKAGLEIKRLEFVDKVQVLENPQALIDFMRPWLPWNRKIPEKKQESFFADLLQNYLTFRPLDEDGKPSFKITCLELEALKK